MFLTFLIQLCFVTSSFLYEIVESNDSFYSHVSNQIPQCNEMIHFITFSVPLHHLFHSLIHSITKYQTYPILVLEVCSLLSLYSKTQTF
ncbi:hypothetical protein Hanom_Chr07g00582731 [Helianthus anomalus]